MSSFFFLEVKIFQNHSLLSFSFPLLIILFTFLAPFFLNSQNALLNPTSYKTAPKHFFKFHHMQHMQADALFFDLRPKVKSTEPCSVQGCKSLSLSGASGRCS